MTKIDMKLDELLASLNKLFDTWERLELSQAQKKIERVAELRAKVINRVVQDVSSYQRRIASERAEEK